MRLPDDSYSYEPRGGSQYQSPPYIPPTLSGGYQSPPYIPSPAPSARDPYAPYQSPPYIPIGAYGRGELDTGTEYGNRVSWTGPTASGPLYGSLNPFLRAGSLLSGGLPASAGYRAGRGMAYQRGFTVEAQERLRRRKRNRFMEY